MEVPSLSNIMEGLPSIIIIQTYVHKDPDPHRERFVLLRTTIADNNLWIFDVIENSKDYIKGGSMMAVASRTSSAATPINVLRYRGYRGEDTCSGKDIYSTNIWRTHRYVYHPMIGEISEYAMSNPNKVLPDYYNDVGNCKDLSKRYHFTMTDLVVPIPTHIPTHIPSPIPTHITSPIPTPFPLKSIPVHIFRHFADAAISNKERCPITMDELTRENLGAPPCGHLFVKEGLVSALKANGKCPTCRAPSKINEIQIY